MRGVGRGCGEVVEWGIIFVTPFFGHLGIRFFFFANFLKKQLLFFLLFLFLFFIYFFCNFCGEKKKEKIVSYTFFF